MKIKNIYSPEVLKMFRLFAIVGMLAEIFYLTRAFYRMNFSFDFSNISSLESFFASPEGHPLGRSLFGRRILSGLPLASRRGCMRAGQATGPTKHDLGSGDDCRGGAFLPPLCRLRRHLSPPGRVFPSRGSDIAPRPMNAAAFIPLVGAIHESPVGQHNCLQEPHHA